MRWSFPSNNNTELIGISNPGIENFQGTQLKSLAREICQNSLDAALDKQTAKVEFSSFILSPEGFPDLQGLREAFLSARRFWMPQNSTKAVEFFERALKMVNSGEIPFLRISDFNTTGLLGSKQTFNTPWTNLTKSSGISDKSGTAGGSFGIGKYAPYACSELRTVFYQTLDIEGVRAGQGISRITSYLSESGEITIGIGYYGQENHAPFYDHISLDPEFSRLPDQTGTDIYIAGFGYAFLDWKPALIVSILEGFLYAIFAGRLIVKIEDVLIDKDTLPDLLVEYQNQLSESAEKYYRILASADTKWFETDFRKDGIIRLGLIIDSDMHRRVAMIRKTGMKIMDRGSYSGIIPFAGVMLIEGERVNDFLRSLENPQHTKWEPQRIEPKHRLAYAKQYIKDLYGYVSKCLDELKQDAENEELDPDVGDYLPDITNLDSEEPTGQIEEIISTIKAIEKSSPPPNRSPKSVLGNLGYSDSIGDDSAVAYDSGTGHADGKSRGAGKGVGEQEGAGAGKNLRETLSKIRIVDAVHARFVCISKSEGRYSLTFVPSRPTEKGYLELYLAAESQSYDAPITSARILGQGDLKIERNRITDLRFEQNVPLRILLSIAISDYCSLEVKAYGY